MSRSRDIADLAGVTTRLDQVGNSDGALSNRNMVTNGSMAVAQRATSVTGVSSTGYHTCDRYRAAFGRSEYVCTVSQDTSAPSGFANSYKIATTTAESSLSAGDQINITQRLEGQDLQRLKKGTADAQPLTVSFWVKSSITATWSFSLYDADNTRHCSKPYTTDVANTWEYKTIAFPADTTGAFGNDNGAGLFVRFWLDGGTTYTSGTQQSSSWASYTPANDQYAATGFMTTANSTWQITGLQLELGDTSTDFEHISYGDQLQKCQRYYQNNGLTSLDRIYTFQYHPSYKGLQYSYFCQMRAAPAITRTNGGNTITVESITNQKFFGYVASGVSDATPHYLHTVSFDAEL